MERPARRHPVARPHHRRHRRPRRALYSLHRFNVPPETRGIKEGSDLTALGAQLGRNDFNNVSYDGPCPPKGERHRYGFRVFALDTPLTVKEGAPRADVDAAMSAHVLGEGTAIAMFAH
jgi:Raf kinase inhibitor-like YbhB/YbcL family protein